jgi:hypothetical protein
MTDAYRAFLSRKTQLAGEHGEGPRAQQEMFGETAAPAFIPLHPTEEG